MDHSQHYRAVMVTEARNRRMGGDMGFARTLNAWAMNERLREAGRKAQSIPAQGELFA